MSSQTRLPGLDAVRGAALVAVVAYHLGYLRGGFLGVDLFFVLSGFLVTGLAMVEVDRTDGLGLRAFWGRRFRRLAPALLVMVPVTMAAALWLSWPTDERRALAIDGVATLSWWANWRQIIAPDGGYWSEVPSLFRHAWSLSIEEQFYVLWPIVIVGCVALAARGHRKIRLVVGLVAGGLAGASAVWAGVLAHRLDDESLSRVYLGSDARAVAPLLGCVLATVWWGRRAGRWTQAAGWVASVLLVGLTVVTGVSDPSTYRLPVLPLAAVLAAITITGATGWTRIDPVSRWLGQRSYGLYLWSWPIQVLVLQWKPMAGRDKVALATVLATVVLAELSWQLVERPVQHRVGWASRVQLRWALGPLALAGAAAIVTTSMGTATAKAPHETMTAQEMKEAALAAPPSETDPGGSASGEKVMVFGDSVAFSFGRYADEIGPVEGVASIDNRGVPFCGVLSTEVPDPGRCATVNDALATGLSGHPDVILWLPGGWEGGQAQIRGEHVPAMSSQMAGHLETRILDVARQGEEVGARMIIVEWACPGPKDAPIRANIEGYVPWLNATLRTIVEAGQNQGLDIALGQPPPAVCVGGANGTPTPAKNVATKDEVHAEGPDGAEWIWQNWLGPIIRETI